MRPWVLLLVAVLLAGCSKSASETSTFEKPDFDVAPDHGDATTTFSFEAGPLADANDAVWDFGDGTTAHGRHAEHTYGFTNGAPTITLLLTARDGKQAVATRNVTLGSGHNAPPTVSLGVSSTWVAIGDVVELNAHGSDKDQDPLTYTWSTGGTILPATASRTSVTFDKPGRVLVEVRARDPKGGEVQETVPIDVSKRIPPSFIESHFNGTVVAGTAGTGVAEKAWAAPAPDSGLDSARHPLSLKYPGTTMALLRWNDSSGQGVVDLDLELRDKDNQTLFKSETRAPAAPIEYNVTELKPGDYFFVVRGVAGAKVEYDLDVYTTLSLTPELVDRTET